MANLIAHLACWASEYASIYLEISRSDTPSIPVSITFRGATFRLFRWTSHFVARHSVYSNEHHIVWATFRLFWWTSHFAGWHSVYSNEHHILWAPFRLFRWTSHFVGWHSVNSDEHHILRGDIPSIPMNITFRGATFRLSGEHCIIENIYYRTKETDMQIF